MLRLKDLLNEIAQSSFFNDKLALGTVSSLAKEIKQALYGVEVWHFVWSEYNFDEHHSRGKKKYGIGVMQGGSIYDIIVMKKSDYKKAFDSLKTKKLQDRLESLVQKNNWKSIFQKGTFLTFLNKTNSIPLYRSTFDKAFDGSDNKQDVTETLWNNIRQEEFSKMKITGALYHCSQMKYESGDVIKPYFDPKAWAEQLTSGMLGGYGMALMHNSVEDVLEKNRPGSMPSRSKSGYVFKEIDDAYEYVGGNARPIYAVKTDEKIQWVDMRWVDEMEQRIGSFGNDMDGMFGMVEDDEYEAEEARQEKELEKDLKDMAKKYWSGKATDNPAWEGIVKKELTVIRRVR